MNSVPHAPDRSGHLSRSGFPLRLFAAAFGVSLLAAALGIGLSWRMHESLDRLAATQSELADYTGRVMLLDEALTVSARIAAKTGNPIDAQRYDELATKLGTLIKETKEALSDPAILRSVDQTEQANRHLVEIERRGITIASDGRVTEATAQLDNDEYQKWKAVFAGGVEKTVAQEREAIARARHQSRQLTFAPIEVADIGERSQA